MIYGIYIGIYVISFLVTFINLSKGKWFENETIKGIVVALYWVLLIVAIVLLTINYGWWHIIIVPIASLIISQIHAAFIIRFFYGGKI